MSRLGRYGRGPLLALLGVAVAGAALVWTGWRAVVIEPVEARVQDARGAWRPVASQHEVWRTADLAAAVDNGPFRPDRARPPERFRLPGESTSGWGGVVGESGSMLLIGTVVYQGGGGAAVVVVAGSLPQIVRVGERLGDLTLQSVDRGEAVFVTASGSPVVIRAPKPGG